MVILFIVKPDERKLLHYNARKQASTCSKLSSGMLRRVALVRTDISNERSHSIFKVTRIGELGTIFSSNGFTRTTRRNIPEDNILHSHRRGNL
jgi:hypothetical protein